MYITQICYIDLIYDLEIKNNDLVSWPFHASVYLNSILINSLKVLTASAYYGIINGAAWDIIIDIPHHWARDRFI